ncbi:MAG: citrate lyase holo-[acyl-carrier protein] synthase [Negativicutes bacterium]|nr:citrate lyase holo-[acyl-carrier protein] synthase [Negativicutes bacterium]
MITLNDVLAAKEARKVRQDRLRESSESPVVSITINMAGDVKDTYLTRQLRDHAVREVTARMAVVALESVNLATGPEAVLAVGGVAREIKGICKMIEEEQPFGRLLDLDVFDAAGNLVSRQEEGHLRRCLVCNDAAVVCMRERRHSQTDISLATQRLFDQFIAHQTRSVSPAAENIGALALEAMLFEVACTPAPGLVDRANSGSHSDMDFYSFMASSGALALTMARCAQAGLWHETGLESLLPILRLIGKEGERAMGAATGGVNTQKGAIFSLGVAAAAAGWLRRGGKALDPEGILATMALIVSGIVARDFGDLQNKSRPLTAGERLYRDHGITGIRGEMEQGLPCVRRQALPALQQALAAGQSINNALVQTLLVLMTCVEDTTVMHRHHPDKMRTWVRARAGVALAAGGMYTEAGRAVVAALDQEFIQHNVSPGGAADLLAVTWFLYRLTAGH